MLVYVDDILVTRNNNSLIYNFIGWLNKTFTLKDLGYLSFFLGVKVQRTKEGLHLSQTGYPFNNIFFYRSTIGALQYLTITRHEISFIVIKLS